MAQPTAIGPVLLPETKPTVTKTPGQQVVIEYDADHVIELQMVEKLITFDTTLTLADNSCSTKIGTKVRFVLPLGVKYLFPIWKRNPTAQGLPVLKLKEDKKSLEVAARAPFFTRKRKAAFEQLLNRVQPRDRRGMEIQKVLQQNPQLFNWIECDGNCNGIIPESASTILFWDHNFERSNDELSLTKGVSGPTVNRIISRLQGVPLTVRQNRIYFNLPQSIYGEAEFTPPGVSYQILWTFQSKNIVDPQSELCQMTWEIDFTKIFTQYNVAFEAIREQKFFESVKPSLKPFIYTEIDEATPFVQTVLEPGSWMHL